MPLHSLQSIGDNGHRFPALALVAATDLVCAKSRKKGFWIPFGVGKEAGSRSTDEVRRRCFQERTASTVTGLNLT
ncbi:hypothetical protein Y5W_02664 [Alcanivorax sp. 521-1]|uniref:Secreted protein n=1 Tax=Alloalcanivorax profundimaris TaxID=2735259 RepID=A0ABS0AVQ1_9GAMM|nr:hypothetical protein [Alloalcanivorax profundimaris]